MVKTKVIRIKKPTGGTRLQKVQVLKSGKLKFMKNRGKGFKGSTISTKVTRSRASSKSKGGKSVARRRRRASKARAKKPTTLPVGLLLPGGAGTISTAKDILEAWVLNRSAGTSGKNVLRMALLRTTGIDVFKSAGDANRFDPMEAHFSLGWIAGSFIHWLVGKKAGVNRALGAAKVPWLRV